MVQISTSDSDSSTLWISSAPPGKLTSSVLHIDSVRLFHYLLIITPFQGEGGILRTLTTS